MMDEPTAAQELVCKKLQFLNSDNIDLDCDLKMMDGEKWMEVELDGNTLPHVEEYKAQIKYRPKPYSWRQPLLRRKIIVALLVLLLALIIALSAILTREEGSKGQSKSFAAMGDLMDVVLNEGWSTKEQLQDPISPQMEAIDSISQNDEQDEPNQVKLKERYAVTTLYFATSGPNWHRQGAGFLQPDVDICQWFDGTAKDERGRSFQMGIDCTCDNVAPENKDICLQGSSTTVKRIVLVSMNLHGSLPPELRLLQDLIELDFNHNAIKDVFPNQLESIPRLSRLDISYNSFRGPLSDSMDQFQLLQHLDISHNGFSDVPNVASMFSLKLLNAINNKLTGDITTIFGNMANLQALFVSKNFFSGQIDHDFMKSLPNLEVMDAGENLLTGNIPKGVLGHPNLAVLDMHNNDIEGEFPQVDPTETKLQYLSLRENRITGSLSPTLVSSSRSLYHLDLAKNMMEGAMPPLLGKFPMLEYLDMSFNTFDAAGYPRSLGELRNLKYLALQNTNLMGFLLYESVANWTKIEVLDLGNNLLVGVLPTSLGASTPNLQKLVLYNNALMGNLNVLEKATKLDTLIINGGNAWDEDELHLNSFCNKQTFPNMETILAQSCTTTISQDGSVPFCSCCECCPNNDCGLTFWFSDTDPAWGTKYVLGRFREHEVIVPDALSGAP